MLNVDSESAVTSRKLTKFFWKAPLIRSCSRVFLFRIYFTHNGSPFNKIPFTDISLTIKKKDLEEGLQ